MPVDTKNEDIIKKYFDLVQDEIKKLISEDKEIKQSQIETFNNEIFNQTDEIKDQIKNFVDRAAINNLDIKRIAKSLYDKFKIQVKNNIFNQTDSANVPNKIMGEKTMNFDTYNNKKLNELKIGKTTLPDILFKPVTGKNNNNDPLREAYIAGQNSVFDATGVKDFLNKNTNWSIPTYEMWKENKDKKI